MTYDVKGIFRCYEIKVSKADFHSNSKVSFVGNYNYYVMPEELYEEVKDEIPKHIGVHDGTYCLKNAKKQELLVDKDILKNSMIRSLSRDVNKQKQSERPTLIEQKNREISELKNSKEYYYKRVDEWSKKYYDLEDLLDYNGIDITKLKPIEKQKRQTK